MLIRLQEIEDEAFFSGTIELKELVQAYKDVDFVTPVQYSIKIRKTGSQFKVQGHVSCNVGLVCARCLERFTYVVDSELDVDLVSREMAPTDSELELAEEELDIHYYESDELDLEEIIFEEILLSIPMRAICRDNCMGLCERCGGNRNLGECTCQEKKETRLGELLKSYLAKEGEKYGSTEKEAVKVKKG
ncbi:MAG: DUF177 domain-containing protein [Desulfobacterota bacterium]|nr:DUF177 domain-containing protein [Thermodesulfobacteriota bacterium]MDW8002484.1 DUF177 domain-containing protein [Deltaproteobacteria bacterium]